ncbi:MAG: hypothetical protein E7242_04360 [Lachnospiraceae bacterium]|nr:hypothetical protein [Lachnospiraceae bacterium]
MKKKILSIVSITAIMVGLLSSSVSAAITPPDDLSKIKQVSEETADVLAGSMYNYCINQPNLIIDFAYDAVFLTNRLGYSSENITNLNNMYLDAVKSNVNANEGKIKDQVHMEGIDTYCTVIANLIALGKDPTDFENYNIVESLNSYINSEEVNFVACNPAEYIYIRSVFNYFSDSYPGIASVNNKLDETIASFYVKNGVYNLVGLTPSNLSTYGIEDAFATLTEGVDYGMSQYMIWPKEGKADYVLSVLNNSDSAYAGNFICDIAGILYVKTDYRQESAIYISSNADPFECETNSYYILPLSLSNDLTSFYKTNALDDPQGSVTVPEIIDGSLAFIHKSIPETGIINDKINSYPSMITGTTLRTLSVFNKTADAKKLYEGLMTLRLDNGQFKKGPDDSSYSIFTTGASFDGIVGYYCLLSGLYNGNIYDLSATGSEISPDNVLPMTEPENTSWSADSGEWLRFSSPAPLASFTDLYIDGKDVLGELISGSLEEGAATFAAVGGGIIRLETGSTIVSLSPEFLSTLPNGDHTIRIQSVNGFAESSFSVTSSASDTTPAATPSTADNSNITLFICLLASGAGIAIIASKRKLSER